MSELYALGSRLSKLERPKAEARQLGGLKQNEPPFVENSTNEDAPYGEKSQQARYVVGPAIGLSPAKWSELKSIGDAAANASQPDDD